MSYYNPEWHHRRSTRRRGYDYTAPGACFVTICAHRQLCLFEDEAIREIITDEWRAGPIHRTYIRLDEFMVMPNHFHALLWIVVDEISPEHKPRGKKMTVSPQSLGAVIRGFKSAVTRRVRLYRNNPAKPVWQCNYYDRIVRDEDELHKIRQYIRDNPQR